MRTYGYAHDSEGPSVGGTRCPLLLIILEVERALHAYVGDIPTLFVMETNDPGHR